MLFSDTARVLFCKYVYLRNSLLIFILFSLQFTLPSTSQVLLGGGRSKFYPVHPTNPSRGEGERRDGRDLVEDWREDKKYRGKATYVTDRRELLNIDVKHTDYLLGKRFICVVCSVKGNFSNTTGPISIHQGLVWCKVWLV